MHDILINSKCFFLTLGLKPTGMHIGNVHLWVLAKSFLVKVYKLSIWQDMHNIFVRYTQNFWNKTEINVVWICCEDHISRYTDCIYREYLVSVFRYLVYQARFRECLFTSQGLPSDSTCVLEAEPDKLDIKRPCKYDVIIDFLCRFSVIGDVI